MASGLAGIPFQALEWLLELASNNFQLWLTPVKEASRLVVPIGALYTPLKEKPDTPLLQYEPVTCKAPCRAVLNPFAYVFLNSVSSVVSLTLAGLLTFVHDCGSALSVYRGMVYLLTTKT